MHQATLRDTVRCAVAMVADEDCALPGLQAAFKTVGDTELACGAALGPTRHQRTGGPLPLRLPIQCVPSADGRAPGESLPPSHHLLPRGR